MADKPRKTVPVRELKDMVNYHLGIKDEKLSTPESRRAMASLLESVLMRANCYRGFKYRLSEWDVERHELRAGYDDTRREYY